MGGPSAADTLARCVRLRLELVDYRWAQSLNATLYVLLPAKQPTCCPNCRVVRLLANLSRSSVGGSHVQVRLVGALLEDRMLDR